MNHFYYGDNLEVLRQHVADATVHLIYLAPPFPRKSVTVTPYARDRDGRLIADIQVHAAPAKGH